MPRPIRKRVGALLICASAFGAAAAPVAQADTTGGSSQSPAAVVPTLLGSMTWGFYDPSVLTTWPNETNDVRVAMNQAINDYNTVARYGNYVPVTFNPGIPTAEASYNGSVGFGGIRNARAAQHELAHFMGMQGWVNGGKSTPDDLCRNGWANTLAIARMRLYTGDPNAGIGCSLGTAHFWDYGLNYDNEWNWLSKGRNVGIVGAMRADIGLSDGSALAPENFRVASRSTGQVAADQNLSAGGAAVGAPSTVATQQTWTIEFVNGLVRLKNLASGRYLDGSGATAKLTGTATPGAAQTWEMAPSTDGYFQLRNQQSNQCLRAPSADAALTIVGCDGNPDAPATALQWRLAKVPAAPAPTPTPTPTPAPTPTPTPAPTGRPADSSTRSPGAA